MNGALLALTAVLGLSGSGTADAPADLIYVANQAAATVSVIDPATDAVIRTIDLQDLGYTANAKPHHVAVEPDGSAIYVSLIGDGFVLKLSPEGAPVGRAAFETPGMLALDPHGDALWVGRSMMAVSPPQRIGRIDRSDMSIEEVDVFFDRPHALALSPDGRHVYTASLAGNDIAVIDVETGRVSPVRLAGPTHVFVQFAIAPHGKTMVTGGELTSQLLVFDLENPARPSQVASIEVGAMPWHPVFSPDGARVYLGNRGANTVTVVRTADWTVEAVVEDSSFAEPHGIAITPDGSKLYVSNRNLKDRSDSDEPGRMNHGEMSHEAMSHQAGEGGPVRRGRVSVIDTGTLRVVDVIEVGAYAAGMGTATPVR
ncbi:MAG: YncE family protein [marine benthic group bacterium]|nr:YncE family protein [Gemmatimonadota bacterium]MCL7964834.1 YncE family protein [Gemmatimonadota bacterium]MCL7981245.1 YncE family protein [Gemmatimonadota bacterium]